MQIAILGRQAAISLAELESLYGSSAITPLVSSNAALVDTDTPLPQTRLGGTIKSGTVLAQLDHATLEDAYAFLQNHITVYATEYVPEGKIQFGVSVYGTSVQASWLLRHTLSLKKALKAAGRSVRVIENRTPALETAQVLYNKLTKEHGIELLVVKHDKGIIIARTTGVQDIDAYAARDQGRPKRDAKVGMLPPKLAQIIINLAVSKANPLYGAVVLDPFCGTGVTLQEATLMGFDIYGSDLDKRMVDYSDQNLMWLLDQPFCPIVRPESEANNPSWRYYKLESGDATNHTWQPMPSFIACETYLGRPFSAPPKPDTLQEVMQSVNLIHKKFLQNVASQTKPGFRMCIAVPAWFIGRQTKHLKVLEILPELGYTRMEFAHASTKDLIYHRENQVVGRELVVLVRK